MSENDYRQFLLGNVTAYPVSIKKKLLKSLIDEGIATSEPDRTLLNEDVVLCGIAEDDQLNECVEKSNRAVKKLEEYEFSKGYKYSFVFGYTGEVTEKIEQLSNEGKITIFNKSKTDTFDYLSSINKKISASYCINSHDVMIKVSFAEEFYNFEGKALQCKYIVLVIFHTDCQIVELRYDSIPSEYNSATFYIDRIIFVKQWLVQIFNVDFISEQMEQGIAYIVAHERKIADEGNFYISGKNLTFGDGGSASLRIGNGDSMVVPLLGELKNLLDDYEDEFEKSPILKCAFVNFLEDREQNAELPCIYLRWLSGKKHPEVKVEFNYLGQSGCRILFYAKNDIRGEEMSYVTRYIGTIKTASHERENSSNTRTRCIH